MATETAASAPSATDLQNGSKNKIAKSVGVTVFSLKPQLIVTGGKGAEAVGFYKSVFGAEELKRDMHPKRKADQELPLILSAELKLGSSVFIISDSDAPDGTEKSDGSGYNFCLEVSDVDGAIENAVNGGAKVEEEKAGEKGCCGARKVKDPFGYVWSFCSVEEGDVAA